MALVLADRIKDTTTTTGTGTVTLSGTAPSGFQSFSAVGNGNTTYYVIAGQGTTEWEVGIGTYTSAGTTLSRTTVLASSNAGSLVTFSAGTKDVFVTYPAGKSVYLDASGNASALGTPASGTVTNLTGTASININGTVGATTPSTGAFTTVTASAGSGFRAVLVSGGSIASFYDSLAVEQGRLQAITSALVLNTVTTNPININVNSVNVGTFSTTGLAVTGTLSATGTLSGGTSGTGYSFSGSAAAGSLTLDSSGNLGLGVTPSAWSIGKAIDISASGAVFGDGVNTAYTAGLSQNAYNQANTWKYKVSSQPASRYELNGAAHAWYTAPSGTAGNAITFTQSLAVGKGTTLALEGATSATGTGIAFPATQSASTDANTLDDYEEGTWTPTQGAGLTVVGTFSSIGRYTKIGDTVFIEGKISASTSLAFTSGAVCGGLPFSASSTYEAMFSGGNQNSNATAILASAGTSLYAQSSMAATLSYYFSGTYKLA